MAYIVSYQKSITRETTKQLELPESATELCTIDGTTYVSLPDDVKLADEQPVEHQVVILTNELRELIKSHSTHVQLINERVKAKIAEKYSVTDELKEIRNSSSPTFSAYADYVEECRAWGREQKAALGLASDTSKHLLALTRRQFKLALLHAGLTDEINTAIAAIADPSTKAVIEIEYNEATEFHRLSDSVSYMCNLLSLTDDEINELWQTAANY